MAIWLKLVVRYYLEGWSFPNISTSAILSVKNS